MFVAKQKILIYTDNINGAEQMEDLKCIEIAMVI